MRSWDQYAADAEQALDDARDMDLRNHTDLANRRRQEAAVLANLAVVAALTAEE